MIDIELKFNKEQIFVFETITSLYITFYIHHSYIITKGIILADF